MTHNRNRYTLEQYKRDCAALSGTNETEEIPVASGVIRRPTDMGIGTDDPEPVSATPNKPSGRIDFSAAIAVGLGPRPNGRAR